MDEARVAKLTYLRFQVRSLKRRERCLRQLHDQRGGGNRAETAAELVQVYRLLREAEGALADLLRSAMLSQ